MKPNTNNDKSLDLSSLDFGPKWVKEAKKETHYTEDDSAHKVRKEKRSFSPQKEGRSKTSRRHGERQNKDEGQYKENKEKRQQKGHFHKKNERRFTKPEIIPLPAGIKASIFPTSQAFETIVKQVTGTARAYSVFKLASVLLKSRQLFDISFKIKKGEQSIFFQHKKTLATFLSEAECKHYFLTSEDFSEHYEDKTFEIEPPTGNFPTIAVCGLSQRPIAPPNYHGYQQRLEEIHAAEFSHLPLKRYKEKVQILREEEKINEWLEEMKIGHTFVAKREPTLEFATKDEAWADYVQHGFKKEFSKKKKVFVPSEIQGKWLSPGLLTGLKEVLREQSSYPGELATLLCMQLSKNYHLAVFKWQGKLHVGAARPHAIPKDVKIAERPQRLLTWVKDNNGKGIDQLWKDVLPENITEEDKQLWFHDLHWIINQGYIIFLDSGSLHLSADAKK